MKKGIILFLLLFYTIVNAQSQHYFTQDDASGYTPQTDQISELSAAAQQLCMLMDSVGFPQFKVFDFGYYSHHERVINGIPQKMQEQMTKAEQSVPYYLIFGKQSNSQGTYAKIIVKMKLPDTSVFCCVDDISPDYRAAIENKLFLTAEKELNVDGKRTQNYVAAEKAAMLQLAKFIRKFRDCCNCPNKTAAKEKSTGCAECPYSTEDFVKNIQFTLKNKYLFDEIGITSCQYSPSQTSPIASEYINEISNLDVTIAPNITFNLDKLALCELKKYHDKEENAMVYILRPNAHYSFCMSFEHKLTECLNSAFDAKIFYILVGEGNDKKIISFTVYKNGKGPAPELGPVCTLESANNVIVAIDQANYYYWAGENTKSEVTLNPILYSSIKEKTLDYANLEKNNGLLFSSSTINVNPYTHFLGYSYIDEQWKVFSQFKWILNGEELKKNATTHEPIGIYYKCKVGPEENLLELHTLSGKVTIKLIKAEPHSIFIAQFSHTPHNNVWVQPNREPQEEINVDSFAKSIEKAYRIKIGSNIIPPTVSYFPESLPKSALIDGKDPSKISIRTYYVNHEGKYHVTGSSSDGVYEDKDSTKYLFDIEWTTPSANNINTPNIEEDNISLVDNAGAFFYSVNVYGKPLEPGEKGKKVGLFSFLVTGPNYVDGRTFEVSIQNSNGVYIPRKNANGTNKRYKTKLGSLSECETGIIPLSKLKLTAYNQNNSIIDGYWEIIPLGPEAQIHSQGNISVFEFVMPKFNSILKVYNNSTKSITLGILNIEINKKHIPLSITPTKIEDLEFENGEFPESVNAIFRDWYAETIETPLFTGQGSSLGNTIMLSAKNAPVLVTLKLDLLSDEGNTLRGYTKDGLLMNELHTKIELDEVVSSKVNLDGKEYNFVKDAFLKIPLTSEEIDCAFNTGPIGTPNEVAMELVSALEKAANPRDKNTANIIKNAYHSSNKPAFDVAYKYRRMLPDDYSKFCTINNIGFIYLNRKALNNKLDFQSTLRHELGHALFAVSEPYINMKWGLISKFYKDNPAYFSLFCSSCLLGDKINEGKKDNTPNCSALDGHEYFNPENRFTCTCGMH